MQCQKAVFGFLALDIASYMAASMHMFFSIPGCIKVVFLLWNRNANTIGTSVWEIDDLVFGDPSNDLEQTHTLKRYTNLYEEIRKYLQESETVS